MLCIACMVILGDHNIKKKVSKTSILELPRVKNSISGLCTGPYAHLSHYCWKQSFRVFGTGFDRPSARLETAKNVLSYPQSLALPGDFDF